VRVGRAPLRELQASPARFVNRPGLGRPQGTMLSFVLARPARVRFTVLAAPSCRPLGAFTRSGHRGVNRIRFLGRLRGRPLPPGAYTLVPRIMRGRLHRQLPRITVVVLSRSASRTAAARAAVKPQCTGAAPRAAAAIDAGTSPPPFATDRSPTAGSKVAAARQEPRETSGAVLAESRVQTPSKSDDGPLASLPVVSALIPEDAPAPPTLLGALALAVVGLGSLILVVLVLRFIRRAWEP